MHKAIIRTFISVMCPSLPFPFPFPGVDICVILANMVANLLVRLDAGGWSEHEWAQLAIDTGHYAHWPVVVVAELQGGH
jgi:hypothetical protein